MSFRKVNGHVKSQSQRFGHGLFVQKLDNGTAFDKKYYGRYNTSKLGFRKHIVVSDTNSNLIRK